MLYSPRLLLACSNRRAGTRQASRMEAWMGLQPAGQSRRTHSPLNVKISMRRTGIIFNVSGIPTRSKKISCPPSATVLAQPRP